MVWSLTCKQHASEGLPASQMTAEQGSAAYFRVTGPTIVLEGSPQQMEGNAANHIHGMYRDPTNDYGAKYTGIIVGT